MSQSTTAISYFDRYVKIPRPFASYVKEPELNWIIVKLDGDFFS